MIGWLIAIFLLLICAFAFIVELINAIQAVKDSPNLFTKPRNISKKEDLK